MIQKTYYTSLKEFKRLKEHAHKVDKNRSEIIREALEIYFFITHKAPSLKKRIYQSMKKT